MISPGMFGLPRFSAGKEEYPAEWPRQFQGACLPAVQRRIPNLVDDGVMLVGMRLDWHIPKAEKGSGRLWNPPCWLQRSSLTLPGLPAKKTGRI